MNGASFIGDTDTAFAPATTIASGSNAVVLPTGTINVGSTAVFTASGTISVTTSAGVQAVAYTSLGANGTTFLGCTGGVGTMSTGGAVTQVSAVATLPAIRARIGSQIQINPAVTSITGKGGVDVQVETGAAVAYGVAAGQFMEVAGFNGNLHRLGGSTAAVPLGDASRIFTSYSA